MKTARLLAVVSLLLLPAATRAADVPVSYLVDAVALKSAVAGTNLTFELHGNSTCTALIDSSLNLVDDIKFLGLKRFKPSGATKPPKTVEIRTTLLNISSPGHLWLKVTGTGITPVGGACQAQAAIGEIPPTCNDTIHNQNETDVDCGGSLCPACAAGLDCALNSDCQSNACSGGICVESCTDGIENQDETGVDCGGAVCPDCGEGLGCDSNADCQTTPMLLTCQAMGFCFTHCSDSVQNGDETDVNCGGTECDNPCPAGQMCEHPGDCLSFNCMSNICQ